MIFLRKYTYSLLLLCAICGCDPAHKKDIVPIPAKSNAAILIGNEGQFQHGDASLTLIDIANNVTILDAFKAANNRSLGDVLQSINKHNELIYLVVNNSGKIEIVNRKDFKSVATISGFTSPRYIAFIDHTKAYVSEFFSTQLKIVNLLNNTISGTIECGGWQEEMVFTNNKLFVTAYQRNQILVIDPNTDQIIDSISVAKNPTALAVDQSNKLWVGCNGENGDQASLFVINTNTNSKERSFSLGQPLLRKMSFNKALDKLYVLSQNVFQINISDTSTSSTPFILNLNSSHTFYGLGVDPQNDDIYVSDAIDFQQRSDILHFDKSGQSLGLFKAGVNSNCFYFDYN